MIEYNYIHNVVLYAKDAVLNDGGARNAVIDRDGRCWQSLRAVPWQSELWRERYPVFRTLLTDVENREIWDEADFPANPSGSFVGENIAVNNKAINNRIAESVFKYSKISDNAEYTDISEVGFTDAEDEDFRLKEDAPVKKLLPDFPEIPFELIGRY